MQDNLSHWRQVADELGQRFQLATTQVELPGRSLQIVHPRSADALIDEADFNRDERLPYWAEIWPAAQALALHVSDMAGDGRRCLELGCGLGLVSIAAQLAGFKVVATDYYPEALEFARFNAALNGLPQLQTRLVDWRAYPDDLYPMDLILAADVLYESRLSPLVVEAIDRSLAPNGIALVADPSRGSAERFISDCQQASLAVRETGSIAVDAGNVSIAVKLYAVNRPKSANSQLD